MMLVSTLTFLLVVVQVQFSIGDPVVADGPTPMPDFQIEKTYGVWYVKLMLLEEKFDIKCGKVEGSEIDKESFKTSFHSILGNGTVIDKSATHTLVSPGVYNSENEDGKKGTLTFILTDYENYSVYTFTCKKDGKDHKALSVVGKNPTGPLPEETVNTIKKALEDQKIDISAGFTSVDNTVEC